MNIRISFPYEAFESTVEAFKFIDSYINFYKGGILTTSRSGFLNYNYSEIIKYLDKTSARSFNLVSNNSSTLEFNNSVTFRREQSKELNMFAFTIEDITKLKFTELIYASAEKKFTFCFLFNFDKCHWQNERVIDNYKVFHKPYEHLPKVWDDELSPVLGELIDISKNPGHLQETYQFVLMAAPEMWFGPGSWKVFDKKIIVDFPEATEIKEILNDVVYIRLFDWKTADYEDFEIIKLQKDFRKWTKMDTIEEELNKKVVPASKIVSMKLDLSNPNKPKGKLDIKDLEKQKRKK